MRLMTVMYHFVMDPDETFPALKTLPTESFFGQLDYLLRYHKPLTMSDVRDAIEERTDLPDNGFLLTFDHGTRDHVEVVLPELLRRGIEAAFFPMTSVLEHKTIPGIDKQRFLEGYFTDYGEFLRLFCEKCVEIAPDLSAVATPSRENLEQARSYLHKYHFYSDAERFFRNIRDTHLTPAQFLEIIRAMFSAVCGPDDSFADRYYLDWDDVKRLRASGMAIGSHGHDHIIYSRHNTAECRTDLRTSFDLLRRRLGTTSIDSLAYPNGGYGPHMDDILSDAGVTASFTTIPGVEFSAQARFQLQRVDTADLPINGKSPIHRWSEALTKGI